VPLPFTVPLPVVLFVVLPVVVPFPVVLFPFVLRSSALRWGVGVGPVELLGDGVGGCVVFVALGEGEGVGGVGVGESVGRGVGAGAGVGSAYIETR